MDKFGNPTPEALANACLSAAAPEMLEALERTVEWGYLPKETERLARAAIQAAKGDAPNG